jgi:hypothetical protein
MAEFQNALEKWHWIDLKGRRESKYIFIANDYKKLSILKHIYTVTYTDRK